MNLENLPPVPPTPKEFWEDRDWAYENLTEIEEKYPNLWIAVADKQVVAAGKVIAEVEKKAAEITGRKNFFILLAERGIHVYKSTS